MADVSEKIQPALTPEEWAEDVLPALWKRWEFYADASDDSHMAAVDAARISNVMGGIKRGQPFGFTWEDVDDCRDRADDLEAEAKDSADHDVQHGLFLASARWRNRADRIAALLPPREP